RGGGAGGERVGGRMGYALGKQHPCHISRIRQDGRSNSCRGRPSMAIWVHSGHRVVSKLPVGGWVAGMGGCVPTLGWFGMDAVVFAQWERYRYDRKAWRARSAASRRI